jgi:hypothetical protein
MNCATTTLTLTGSQTYKKYGIPQGLPYLTGFVIHCAILDELQAD